jgi:hypothetical protein
MLSPSSYDSSTMKMEAEDSSETSGIYLNKRRHFPQSLSLLVTSYECPSVSLIAPVTKNKLHATEFRFISPYKTMLFLLPILAVGK